MPELRPLPPVLADPGARGVGHFIKRNPILAVLVVAGLVAAGAVGWFISSNLYPPTTHMTAFLYAADQTAAGDGFTVSLLRVTHRPASGIAVRRGDPVVFEWPELIQIDGIVRNDSSRHLAAFYEGGALLSSPDDRVARDQIVSNGNQCATSGWPKNALDIDPGDDRRFSIFLVVDRESGAEWVRDSVKDRVLPRLELGEFAFLGGPCGDLARATLPAGGERVELGPASLSGPEIQDLYPFGGQGPVPTDRAIWKLWVFEPVDLKRSVR